MCNTLYKVISKVIVDRLKVCITSLISPFQTGFVPERPIHENIITAQEVMNILQKKKGRKGFFAIKVVLSKAYDKLNWGFIAQVLREANIPDSMINIIMQSVSSVETNVMWNGVQSEFFRPQRGIRQGDPISSYLFVLYMDKLSHLIEYEVRKKKWKVIKMGS